MKAVNLLPPDTRRRQARAGRGAPSISFDTISPGVVIAAGLLIVVVLILLRVLADNTVNDRRATLAAVNTQVAAEQAQVSRFSPYVSAVAADRQREQGILAIATQRFPWQSTFDALSHVMPASTTLSSLDASTTATAGTGQAGQPISGPTFNLSGCAGTADLDGTATLLRRLNQLPGVSNVGFDSSSKTDCAGTKGNVFSIVLTFNGPTSATATAPATPSGTATTTTPSTATTPATTTPTTVAPTSTAAPTDATTTSTGSGA